MTGVVPVESGETRPNAWTPSCGSRPVTIEARFGTDQPPAGRSIRTRIAAIEEALDVAAAADVGVGGEAVDRAAAVAEATATNESSMLRDVRAGSRTEVGATNGVVVDLADDRSAVRARRTHRVVVAVKYTTRRALNGEITRRYVGPGRRNADRASALPRATTTTRSPP